MGSKCEILERLLNLLSSRHSRTLRFVLILELLLVAFTLPCGATEPDKSLPENIQTRFSAELEWLETEDALEPQDVWGQTGFHRSELTNLFFRQKQSSVWFRFETVDTFSGHWFLHSSQFGIDRLSVFFRKDGEGWKPHEAETFAAVNSARFVDLHQTIELPTGWNQMLVKLDSRAAAYSDFKLIDSSELLEKVLSERSWMGAIYTLLVALSFLFVLGRISLKVKKMLWLTLASLLLLAVVMTLDGHWYRELGLSGFVSSARVVFVLLVLVIGCHLRFVCSRYLQNSIRTGLLGTRYDFIAWVAFLGMAVFLPLWAAGVALLVFMGLVWIGLLYLGSQQKIVAAEQRLTNLSNLLLVVVSGLLVFHFFGSLAYSLNLGRSIRVLVVLVPFVWALSLSRSYRQMTAEHDHAHRESMGYRAQLQEAFESRLQVFSSIAHNLNNPLNYILLGVAKARDELGDVQRQVNTLFEHADQSEEATQIKQRFDSAFEKCRTLFGDALFGVQRAARVVDEMRGLTNIDGDSTELVPLDDILSSMRSRVEDDLGTKLIEPVTLQNKINQSANCSVYGNPYLIIHALKNVVKNGYLFARRSSSVRPTLVLEVDHNCEPGFVRFLVSNNGPAISKEHEPIIFRMGFSSYGRRGTGLNVSQSILRESGGKVLLSDHGRDSGWVTFSILLPMQEFQQRSIEMDTAPSGELIED